MTQSERRSYLINYLVKEKRGDAPFRMPESEEERITLLRSLLNVRMPGPADDAFIRIQDEYLSERTREKGVTDADRLKPSKSGLYVWQGDITTLRCGAIVNAANSQLLGCFRPGHNCIDNVIHSAAGLQLREECARIMHHQGHPEPTGRAKLTGA